ncbi:DNA repair endonuclease XPF [Geodia barretti]|nr:DNA repair endonuclease XPF [Geodia barretti]
MLLDSANIVFARARERVFGDQMSLCLEESPKWHLLRMVLEEVRGEVGGGEGGVGSGRVLVVVNDERTSYQLKQFLCSGGRSLLEQQFHRFLSQKYPQYQLGGGGVAEVGGARKRKQAAPRKAYHQQSAGKSGEPRDGGDREEEDTAALYEGLGQAELQFSEDGSMKVAPPTSKEDHTHFRLLPEPVVVFHALEIAGEQPHQLHRVLDELRPRYVVMYDPDVRSVRQLEVYQSSHPETRVRVYFLLYDISVEEQRYLTALRREKEAFQQLIRERAQMVLPVDQGVGGAKDFTDHTHSRRAGGQSSEEKVIVDMREFRSSLPSLLHKRGINILPLTLEVGDYVLTPDVCVERKSVSDLISSLNSGRLYSQATALTRHYPRPLLLIEFPHDKSFSLQSLAGVQSDMSSQSPLSKLVLLTLHFPALRVMWCSSPHATVELFLELKRGHAQPDAAQAVSIGQDSLLGSGMGSGYNGAAQDFLMKLPGINSRNCRVVLEKVKDLQELVSLSQEQLEQLLGNSNNASLLFSFLHSCHSSSQD